MKLPVENTRYEVIAGELYVTPTPDTLHQRVSARLSALLGRFCEEHGAGIAFHALYDVILGDGDYVEPDLMFVRRERAGIIQPHGIVGTPDLVLEILSETTAERDRGIKRPRYAAYGVPEYWIVDPAAKQVEVYRLGGGDLRRVEVADDVLRYRPMPGGPALVIDVPHLLRPANDISSRSRFPGK